MLTRFYATIMYFQVQESMENLEYVVRERNRAYFELETGGSGERERVIRQGKQTFTAGLQSRGGFQKIFVEA